MNRRPRGRFAVDMTEILRTNREHIVGEWTRRFLTEVGSYYAARPGREIGAILSRATDANFEALTREDFSPIDGLIEEIGTTRTELLSSLSEGRKSFEIYRSIVMPILVEHLDHHELTQCLDRLNRCLTYTVERFMKYFKLRQEHEAVLYAESVKNEMEKRTEELRESENMFRDLAEKATVGIYLLQHDRIFMYVNSRLAEIVGRNQLEIMGNLGPEDIVHPEDWLKVEESVQRRMAGEIDSFCSEFRIVRENGEVRNVELYSATTSNRGRPAVIGTFLDVTERKQAEEALQRSEKRYHGLFENLRDGFAAAGMDKKITEANPAFQAMFGYTREELSELSYEDLTAEDWRDVEARIIRKEVMKRGYSDVYEKECRRKDGGRFPVEVRVHLERDEKGNPEEMWGFMRDVTERAKAQKALQEQEVKYRTLFESAKDAIFTMRKDRSLDCNSKTLELFGCTKSQFIERAPYSFSPPFQPDGIESADKAAAKVRAALRGRPQSFEWKHSRPDGTLFDAEVTLDCIEIQGERVLQGIVRDITKRKEYERELTNKSLALEDANAALRVMLQQRERDKDEMEQKILCNARELVFPYIDRLKQFRLDSQQRSYLEVLEMNLRNIMSQFVQKMTSINITFTPTEIKVANLIRDGKTVKEIAEMLGVSLSAINLHRQNLRNKLGLNNVKVNLRTYLMSSFNQ